MPDPFVPISPMASPRYAVKDTFLHGVHLAYARRLLGLLAAQDAVERGGGGAASGAGAVDAVDDVDAVGDDGGDAFVVVLSVLSVLRVLLLLSHGRTSPQPSRSR